MKFLVILSMILLFASSLHAEEEEETAEPIELEEIVTVGTRVPERSVLESPVPVDVINEDAIRKTGHTEVGRVLQTLAPLVQLFELFNQRRHGFAKARDAQGLGTGSGIGAGQRETAARQRVDSRQHLRRSRYGGCRHERDSGKRNQAD